MSKKILQAAAGAAGREPVYVEDVFSTYLYEGLTNWNIRQEITTSAKTNNHFVILSTLGNNLGSGNNSGSNETNYSNSDFLLKANSSGSSNDGTHNKRVVSLHYNSSSSGEYIGRTFDSVDSTGEYFGYAATFNYGDATGVTKVNDYSNFDFTSSGSDIQSGDLLLFISMDSASATQSTLPSGFTEIFYEDQSGTYGFAIRAAAKIADGTENGTDYGDDALLSGSGIEQGIILRKTGGSWDISEMVSSLAEETNTLESGSKIINDIDLDGEGGLVWIKSRTDTGSHIAVDTERGGDYQLYINSDSDQDYLPSRAIGFNTDGFSVSNDIYNTNKSGQDYTSWSFRKQPGFFDVVSFSTVGDGTAQSFSHNLGSVPAVMIVKKTSSTRDWYVYHKDLNGGTNPEQYYLQLNGTNAEASSSLLWDNTAPTSTQFTLGGAFTNSGNEGDFVAYLFADNDTRFGDDSDESIIKCGIYTGNGSTNGPEINLGWEPQWILVKRATGGTANWFIFDSMRGIATDSNDALMRVNLSDAEASFDYASLLPTGFKVKTTDQALNATVGTYIYIAIRRPMKTPESGTEVFAADGLAGATAPDPWFTSGFPVDMSFTVGPSNPVGLGGWFWSNRFTPTVRLDSSSTAAESSQSNINYDYMTGAWDANTSTGYFTWMFKRATGFFDVVAYTGDGGTTQTLNHSLGVTPEFIIGKRRNDTQNWVVYHSLVGAGKYYNLNTTSGANTLSTVWGGVAPTSTQFTVGNSTTVNFNGDSYITYFFATLAGVSKVGSYTGTAADLDVDCGFSAGARFILIKRSDSTGDWYVYDSVRGITSGNDPYLLLNSTAVEVTSTDYIDPLSSGFTVTSSAPAGLNASGGTYIFLAIA